jgi:hypothetical protein
MPDRDMLHLDPRGSDMRLAAAVAGLHDDVLLATPDRPCSRFCALNFHADNCI